MSTFFWNTISLLCRYRRSGNHFEFEKLLSLYVKLELKHFQGNGWLTDAPVLLRRAASSGPSIMRCVSPFVWRWFKCPLCIIGRLRWHTQSRFVFPSVRGPANACHIEELKAPQLFNLLLWSAGAATDISCLSHSWYSPSGPCSRSRTVINHLSLSQHKCTCAVCTVLVLLTAI